MKHNLLILCAITAILALQTGCASSPIALAGSPTSYPNLAIMGLGAAGGAIVGQGLDDKLGAPIGAAVALAGTAAYLKYRDDYEAKLVAEAKEEARREERAKLMQDYWVDATGADSVGSWRGSERDVRYDAGIYDGIAYQRRNLPRDLYFQEPPR